MASGVPRGRAVRAQVEVPGLAVRCIAAISPGRGSLGSVLRSAQTVAAGALVS